MRVTLPPVGRWVRRAIIAASIGCWAGFAVAQNPLVLVCARDARDGAPLPGAHIRLIAEDVDLEADAGREGCAWLAGAFPVVSEDLPALPAGIETGAIYPNPAGERAWLPVRSDRAGAAELHLFDVLGRDVWRRNTSLAAGEQALEIPTASLARGVYMVRLVAPGGTRSETVIVGNASNTAPSAPGASKWEARSMAAVDEVRIEISRDGYLPAVETRVLRNFERIERSLLKNSDAPVPLIDMEGMAYRGFEGGLYPGATNTAPEAHRLAGLEAARSIEPLNTQGRPDPNGVYILISIGMSNTTDEFCGVADPNEPCKLGTFMHAASVDPDVNHDTFVLIDGADPGKTAEKWVSPELADYNRILDEELTPFGYTEKQVQIAWIKLANAPPTGTLPDSEADAYRLKEQYGQIGRSMKARYPNLKMIFFSSRIYGGYATTDRNPEPFAYEQGFAVKWIIEAQIQQMAADGAEIDPIAGDLDYTSGVAPWVGWGPYLWADGTTPRSDGLVWLREDLKDDGVHPAKPGIQKVAGLLMDFFKTSEFSACWFLAGAECR